MTAIRSLKRSTDMEELLRSLQRRGQPGARVPDLSHARGSALMGALKTLHKQRMEGLRLYMALPHLEPFHACSATWRIVGGSNRSSKTFSCTAEDCRAWTGTDPYDKYVKTGGMSLVVCEDLDGVMRLWRSATTPQFKIIRDEHTQLWRAVRPDQNDPSRLDPYDDAYREKWRDAPPFITDRMLLGEPAWEDKRKRIPRLVRFKASGWTVLCRSSNGRAPQGDHYHHGHLDEQLCDETFYEELNRGLVQLTNEADQHRPKAVWSATSQTTNAQLYDLYEAATSGANYVRFFKTTIDQNPYMTPEGRRAFWESLDEDSRAVRYYGEFALVKAKVYGIYNLETHTCEPFPIPHDWARYVSVDPATNHTGTLFAAVDPEDEHVWIYDGFDLPHSDPDQWAAEIARRQPETAFEAFVMDQQMGQQQTTGLKNKRTVASQYFSALERAGVRPNRLGPLQGFFPGCKDMLAREKALLSWLNIRGLGPHTGTPRLQVLRGQVPEQFHHQIKKAVVDPKTGKRVRGRSVQCDLLDCLEYMAHFDPQYSEPVVYGKPAEPKTVVDLFNEKRKRDWKRRRGRVAALTY